MVDNQNKDILLDDPLKDETRKERKMLLGVSVLGIVLVKTGLVPTRISALGIEFSETHQQALLWIVASIDVYFLFAFLIYATADFLAWRKAIERESKIEMKEHYDEEVRAVKEEEVEAYEPEKGENYFDEQVRFLKDRQQKDENLHRRKYRKLKRASWFVSIFRAFFEFGLPVVVGVYSISILWK